MLQGLGDLTRELEVLEVQTYDAVLPLVPARHADKIADETYGCVVEAPVAEAVQRVGEGLFDALETCHVVFDLRRNKEEVEPQQAQQKERGGKGVAAIHGRENGLWGV